MNKILFVSSGNSNSFDVAPFIKAQGESLVDAGVEIKYFSIKRKGLFGYINESFRLRHHLKKENFDIIHAHYTLSGWTAVLSFTKTPIILSLMGTDAYGEYIGEGKVVLKSKYLTILTYLIQPFVKKIICKSQHIASFVYLEHKREVIPNGIKLEESQTTQVPSKKDAGLNPVKEYVLFLGNENNVRKNYRSLEKAYRLLEKKDTFKNSVLLAPFPVKHKEVFKLLSVVDVLVVPSFMEGSPNIVKEAMACNCPVVATDVGDVKWLFGNEPGHFLTSFEPDSIAKNIEKALSFAKEHGRTNGRKRIMELGLDSNTVAQKVLAVYKKALK